MKILNKIKAFFRYKGENAELELTAAEIRNGRVYLHPENDKEHVYCIKSNAVDIFISPNENISEDDLEILDSKQPAGAATNETQSNGIEGLEPLPPITNPFPQPLAENPTAPVTGTHVYSKKPLSSFMPKMKTVSFTMYPDEYEMLMSNIKENGYRKTEFLLACVSAAKKSSMEATYRKYTVSHKERRLADRNAARLAQEQDYLNAQKTG